MAGAADTPRPQWDRLERALRKNEWTLAKDQLLRKEMQAVMEGLLARAASVGETCARASESVATKLVEVDLLINSFERISTVQFVENVSAEPPPFLFPFFAFRSRQPFEEGQPSADARPPPSETD